MEINPLLFFFPFAMASASVMPKKRFFTLLNMETLFLRPTTEVNVLVIKKVSLIETTEKIEVLLF